MPRQTKRSLSKHYHGVYSANRKGGGKHCADNPLAVWARDYPNATLCMVANALGVSDDLIPEWWNRIKALPFGQWELVRQITKQLLDEYKPTVLE